MIANKDTEINTLNGKLEKAENRATNEELEKNKYAAYWVEEKRRSKRRLLGTMTTMPIVLVGTVALLVVVLD